MIDKQMKELTKRNHRLRVSTDDINSTLYILVGDTQVDEVTDLLTKHKIHHVVEPPHTSIVVIDLGSTTDASAAQSLLDSVE